MVYDLIIVGGGASGLMAAAEAGRLGLQVLVCEGQRAPGLKLLICGGGRCNATNARVSEKDYNAGCEHTLRHVLQGWSSHDTSHFFKKWGAPLTEREQGQFFSADDRARSVLKALWKAVDAGGATVRCNTKVRNIVREQDLFNVVLKSEVLQAKAVLVTTGGMSYPATGSDGDGYKFAKQFGHRIVPPRPALTPFLASEDLFDPLAGIVLDVRLSLWAHGRKVRMTEGPFLFTHRGFSGPAVLELSSAWAEAREAGGEILLDFFPAVKKDGIAFLLDGAGQKNLKNVLKDVLPERLIDVLLKKAGVDGGICSGKGELRKEQRHALEKVLRALALPVRNTDGFFKAEITAGGVDLKSVKGATLESRLQDGLYFAGEVLDVDGRIGGFNFQWTWASGTVVGKAILRRSRVHQV